MRIVFYNLQINDFYLKPLEYILFKKRAITKHRYFLDWLLENNFEIANYVTKSGTTLVKPFRNIFCTTFFRKLECKYVFSKNNISNKRLTVLTSPEQLKEDDVIFAYIHFPKVLPELKEIPAKKIIHLIHFYGTKKEAESVTGINFEDYFSAINLGKYSKLFKQNYSSWFTAKYVMQPLAFQERFHSIIPFSERKCKVFATGTVTFSEDEEFIDVYGDACYQPHRKMLFDNKEELSQYIDCYISPYNEIPLKVITEKDNLFLKLWKKMYNAQHRGQQKNYFSFDVVKKYNEYKMFICPEDVNGDYGIGTIEGMACGTAMIGINSGIFEDMGLVSGEHFISYDGTVEDLKQKIIFWQRPENQEKLEKIASKGCEYIRNHCNQKAVAKEMFKVFFNH